MQQCERKTCVCLFKSIISLYFTNFIFKMATFGTKPFFLVLEFSFHILAINFYYHNANK